MVATSNNVNDNNSLLVQLCIKVLSNVAPEGMTTKELAAELDKEVVPGFNGISSSILSSKLNAVFRRSHNDSPEPSSEQLAELPLTRSQSIEVPRRLVYRYSPPPVYEKISSSDNEDQEQASKLDVEDADDTKDNKSEDKDTTPLEDQSMSSEATSEPLTPKENDTEHNWPTAKRRKLSLTGKTSQDIVKSEDVTKDANKSGCPNTPPETVAPRKAQALNKVQQNQPKFNLYYDAVGLDVVTSALTPVAPEVESGYTRNEDDGNNIYVDPLYDYASPETLGLNELDNLVC